MAYRLLIDNFMRESINRTRVIKVLSRIVNNIENEEDKEIMQELLKNEWDWDVMEELVRYMIARIFTMVHRTRTSGINLLSSSFERLTKLMLEIRKLRKEELEELEEKQRLAREQEIMGLDILQSLNDDDFKER